MLLLVSAHINHSIYAFQSFGLEVEFLSVFNLLRISRALFVSCGSYPPHLSRVHLDITRDLSRDLISNRYLSLFPLIFYCLPPKKSKLNCNQIQIKWQASINIWRSFHCIQSTEICPIGIYCMISFPFIQISHFLLGNSFITPTLFSVRRSTDKCYQ